MVHFLSCFVKWVTRHTLVIKHKLGKEKKFLFPFPCPKLSLVKINLAHFFLLGENLPRHIYLVHFFLDPFFIAHSHFFIRQIFLGFGPYLPWPIAPYNLWNQTVWNKRPKYRRLEFRLGFLKSTVFYDSSPSLALGQGANHSKLSDGELFDLSFYFFFHFLTVLFIST